MTKQRKSTLFRSLSRLLPTKKFASGAMCLAALAGPVSQAGAEDIPEHDVRAFLSPEGLNFAADAARPLLPNSMQLGTMDFSLACVEFQQRGADINFQIDRAEISVPRQGIAHVELDLSGVGQGELYADDIYFCAGEATCNDTLTIHKLSAVFDLELEVVDGDAILNVISQDVNIEKEDFSLEISECGFTGQALTDVFEFSETLLLPYLEGKAETWAASSLAPMLEGLLDGFRSDGSLGIAGYSAILKDVDLLNGGMSLRLAASFNDPLVPHACVAEFDDGRGPTDIVGAAPVLFDGGASHANMAINLGLLNKGFYTMWKRGLLCLGSDQLNAIGIDLDLASISAMLPGFPPGTQVRMDMTMAEPPKVKPIASQGTELTAVLNGLIIEIHGERPNGETNTLRAELDVEATAAIAIEPGTNSVVASLKGADIKRMFIQDERTATDAGFDVGRIIELAENHLLPAALEDMGAIPVAGQALAFEGFATILRKMSTNEAYLQVGLDLFKIPENDNTAPSTEIVRLPDGISNPDTAVFEFTGIDSEIPTELLQYQITVDGVPQPLQFQKVYKVGEYGASKSYNVQIAAVDLSGNTDETPASFDVMVDGIAPTVILAGQRKRDASDGAPTTLNWTLQDDLTSAENLQVRAEIYVLDNPADALSTRLIETVELARGATTADIELPDSGGVYRVEIHAVDEAGNDSASTMLLTIPEAGCGCSGSGGQGAGNLAALLLAFAFLRRRVRA